MNSLPNTSGVYSLVFRLSRKTAITFDRKGSQHSFPPGWYLYVGSACGAGGLRGRLARHQRYLGDRKRFHWHVDYFREHATLCEIWYSETADSEFEHHWAKALSDLVGTTVPVLKFGASDCKTQCPSHFFHLSDRPSTAVFRTQLASRELSTKVFVEFIEEPRRTKAAAHGLQDEYLLGRRFLERRRRSIPESGMDPGQWNSLAKRRPARRLAEKIAEQMKVSFWRLKCEIEFATAVETLIENCGADVLQVLFDPNQPQGRKAIMSLSRTSDIRQRYRVNGVIHGLFRSVAPHSDDTVFDTVKFGEVPSRLARARGSLERLLELLSTADEDVLSEAKRLSRHCRLSAQRLDGCLMNRIAPSSEVPRYLGKETLMAMLRSEAVTGRTIGKARQALRLTVKNLWDYEEMIRRGLVPTAKELDVTRREVKQIQKIARLIECRGGGLSNDQDQCGKRTCHRSLKTKQGISPATRSSKQILNFPSL